ncbi:PKD domain-containing protein [Pseudoalteromonas byunsanensis]|uniref:Uncharacterized protein n=1 Tax=Pseudoalteromonas byunsanensis TaxID=327939 RepID=A0A1S1NC85_9GAMM|nr:leucine-rich repeat domain-containing protein [Pseudoalteromonas byunsanensis]OHU97028.1 hypothetical protein BIW53_03320 [Pseudoalteromonas byunsanensis]
MKQILNTKGLALSIFVLVLTACGSGDNGSNAPDNTSGKTPDIVTPAPTPEPTPEPEDNSPILPAEGLEVIERDTFSFSAQVSDSFGSIKSFAWEQTAGKTVELEGTDSNTVEFIAPDIIEDETVTLRLSITNDNNETTSKEFVVTLNAYAQPSRAVIPDKALLKCLMDAQLDMGATAIECTYNPIKSLEGLEMFTQLVSAKFVKSEITDLANLGTMTQLESLTLDYMPENEFSELSNLTNLKSLSIINDSFLPVHIYLDISNMQSLTSFSLEVISRRMFRLIDFDFSMAPSSLTELSFRNIYAHSDQNTWSSLSQLKKLTLDSSYVLTSSELASLSELEMLSIKDGCYEDFNFLSSLTKLKLLEIEDTDYYECEEHFEPQINIDTLKPLSELTTLTLRETMPVENPDSLSALPSLTSLILMDSHVPYEAISQLTSLTKLSVEYSKDLYDNSAPFDLALLSQLNKLESLTLHIRELNNLNNIYDHTELQHLSLGTNNLYELPNISEFAQLKTLSLRKDSNSNENSDHLSELGSSSLLTSLTLDGFDDLTALTQFPSLQELNIWNSATTDLMPISLLSNLKKLTLKHTNNVEDFTPFSQLSALEELELYNSRRTSLTPISQLKNLKILKIVDSYAMKNYADLANLHSLQYLLIREDGGGGKHLCRDKSELYWTLRIKAYLEFDFYCDNYY